MANGKEIINYKTAIEAAMVAQYPGHYTAVFKRLSGDFALPAIVINIPVFVPNEQFKGLKGQMNNVMQTNAFLLYSAADEENEMECLQLSTNLANFINDNCWGLKMTPAKVTLNEPMIVEGLEEYIIQRIDFEQNIMITEKK